MDILVGSVKDIVDLALAIEEAAATVRRNEDVCKQIGKRVGRLSAILQLLDGTETMNNPATSATLKDLEENLSKALSLVTDCQKKHYIFRICTAKDLSEDLRQVNQEIIEYMQTANFANNVQNTIIINERLRDPLPKRGVHLGKKLLKVQPTEEEQGISVAHSSPVLHKDGGVGSSHTRPYDTSGMSEMNGQKNSDVAGFTIFSLYEMKAATDNFSKTNVIGKGGCATVYRGELPDGQVVAIKKIPYTFPQHVEHYIRVFSVLLQHKNVVRLLGYCHEERYEMMSLYGEYVWAADLDMLVVEQYMADGTLSKLIDGSSPLLDWSSTVRIIGGIAEGVAYLHSKYIIHLDLKPSNVLVGSDRDPKICDFELSKIVDPNFTYTRTDELVGTVGFMPPEYVADGIISLKYDVYSVGVIMLRIIGRMRRSVPGVNQAHTDWEPWSSGSKVSLEILFGEHIKTLRDAPEVLGRLNELFDPSIYDESQLNEIKRCIEIGLLCTHTEWTARPTMQGVLEMLKGDLNIPAPKPAPKRINTIRR